MEKDKLQEECGVVGLWGHAGLDAAEVLYLSMYGVQHRGQQSAGIAINDNGRIVYHKELGLVSEIFNDVLVRHLGGGCAGIGHCGYQTSAENLRENALPLVLRYTKGQMAISYNGCLLNAQELRESLEASGFMFQSTSDAEVIAQLLSRERVKCHSIEDALRRVMKLLVGPYALLIMTPNKIVAARDPKGMKPLAVGKLDDAYMFASESSGFDTVGGELLRDIVPGEIAVIDDDGLRSTFEKTEDTAMCIFEFVYFARPDSYIDGVSVYEARFEAGKILAKEHAIDADIVIGVPDSGIPAAQGYAAASGIKYAEGFLKNRYIGRTFIQPSQSMRELAVGLKLNALKSRVAGKRVIIIDDSIVRGTTSKKIVQMLKDRGGAKEVHMLISSPPVKYPCYYGVDTTEKDVLIANRMSFDEICKEIGADSLGFISGEGLTRTPVNAKCGFCYACFDGKYPIENGGGCTNE